LHGYCLFEIVIDYVSHANAAISSMVVDDPDVSELAMKTVQAKRVEVLEFDPNRGGASTGQIAWQAKGS
jgi:hypothetical protein